PFSILFRGCGFLIMYEAGVLAALKEMLPDILKSAPKIYGASSGSIIATLALCDHDFGKGYILPFILHLKRSNAFLSALRSSFLSIFPGRTLFKILKDTLNKYLPTNVHQQVSGKLHVIVTRVHDWRSVVVSDFTSKEDLIQAILCSCFVPLYIGLLPPTYHGVRYVDGELGMWRANFMTQSMITVSAFAGEYDICPKDSPVPFFTFQISDCILHISKRNMCRFLYIL
ncbi:PLPL1 protein, partial [Podilymbus podiceps]|nr:PLPL1 protein [Podilymbus podiceps]